MLKARGGGSAAGPALPARRSPLVAGGTGRGGSCRRPEPLLLAEETPVSGESAIMGPKGSSHLLDLLRPFLGGSLVLCLC